MPYVLIQHKVRDLTNLQTVFTEDSERRRRGGCVGAQMFGVRGRPDEYVVLLEWDDAEKAQRFAESYELREAVEWAGDVTPPRAVVIEELLSLDA